jgi:plastocyanin
MKYVALLMLAFVGVMIFTSQDASGQLSANKAFSLTGNGYATSNNVISDTNIDLSFLTTKTKNTVGFNFQSGTLTVEERELTISDFSGSVFSNGKIFRFTSTASDSDDEFTLKALGRLVDKTTTDSIYSLSGTLVDSNKATTKFVYTTKISEYTPKTIASKSDITIKILEGSANPHERTYQDQTAGFRFNYFSEDRIMLTPGGKITFVNEDTSSHNLKSGTANTASRHKTFNPDDKFSSGEILPGKSWSVTFDEPGFYRLYDENYQWMDITVFVFDAPSSQQIKSNKPLN